MLPILRKTPFAWRWIFALNSYRFNSENGEHEIPSADVPPPKEAGRRRAPAIPSQLSEEDNLNNEQKSFDLADTHL